MQDSDGSRMTRGKLFQMLGPATAKWSVAVCGSRARHVEYPGHVMLISSKFGHKFTHKLQWRRSVIQSGGQGQSGQVVKLFQITPYVSAFQTLNNPCSWQPVGASKISFTFHFWHKSFIVDNLKLAELSNNSFEWKNVTFQGVKAYSDPPTYCQRAKTPTSRIATW